MNKLNLVVFSLCALILAGCTSTSSSTTSSNSQTNQPRAESNVELSISTLAEFDGTGGKSCYVAVSGTIYDLTASPFWQNGEHTTSLGQASCGLDLTTVFETQAPRDHKTTNYLSRYPVVGKLV